MKQIKYLLYIFIMADSFATKIILKCALVRKKIQKLDQEICTYMCNIVTMKQPDMYL